jgi:cobalamin biosynthesis Mg chelatase CobN
MFTYLTEQYLSPAGLPPPPPPVETPSTGCLHPDAPGVYFGSPAEYMRWYRLNGRLRDSGTAPVVGVLLYRKHVITEQPYIPQLITQMEDEGIIPVSLSLQSGRVWSSGHYKCRSSQSRSASSLSSQPAALYLINHLHSPLHPPSTHHTTTS